MLGIINDIDGLMVRMDAHGDEVKKIGLLLDNTSE
jgi:hypothetical protein